MDNVKNLLSQVDEYTLIIQDVEESYVQLTQDMSQSVIKNSSKSATVEIIKENKKIIVKTDMQNLSSAIEKELENLKYTDEDPLNHAEKTPIVKHTHSYGYFFSTQEAEKLEIEMLDFIKSYKNSLAMEAEIVIKEIKTEVNNSYGLNLSKNRRFACFYLAIIGENKEGKKANVFIYIALPKSIEKIKEQLKIEIEENLPLRVEATDLFSGVYDIMITNLLSAEIIESIIEMITGEAIIHNSCLKDKIGTQVMSEKITIIEKPISENYQEYYDIYGEKLSEKTIIENGILNTYILNRNDARKLSTKQTGNSLSFGIAQFTNLYVNSTKRFTEDFSGILVTSFLSMDLNQSTAEISVSISGFYMNNGKKTAAFDNGVLNINLLKMQDIDILDDTYEDGKIFCGSIILRNINVNGR